VEERAIGPLFAVYCDSCHSIPVAQGVPTYLRTDIYETMGGVQGAAFQAGASFTTKVARSRWWARRWI
jgi:hypothetical protein